MLLHMQSSGLGIEPSSDLSPAQTTTAVAKLPPVEDAALDARMVKAEAWLYIHPIELAAYQQSLATTGLSSQDAIMAVLTQIENKMAAEAAGKAVGQVETVCKMSILPSLKICDSYVILGGLAIAAVLVVGSIGKSK